MNGLTDIQTLMLNEMISLRRQIVELQRAQNSLADLLDRSLKQRQEDLATVRQCIQFLAQG